MSDLFQLNDDQLAIQEMARNESTRRRNTDEYQLLLNSYGIQ